MKKTFIAFFVALLVAGTGVAQSTDLPNEDTIAKFSFQSGEEDGLRIFDIVFLQIDGSVVSDKYSYRNGWIARPTYLSTHSTQLPEGLKTSLMYKVRQLSNAETQVTRRDVVCQVQPLSGPNPALLIKQGFSWPAGQYDGELTAVESRTGCWDDAPISLVADADKRVAFGLTESLKATVWMMGSL